MNAFQIRPDQMARFQAIDVDRSGTLEISEIAQAYQHIKFSEASARLLLLSITNKPFIDLQTFPMFDFYVNNIYTAFNYVCDGQQVLNY